MTIIVTHEMKRVEINIKQFEKASTVPAWIYANSKCEGCHWGVDEDNQGDINAQSVVIAHYKDENFVFHESCFEDAKVKKWIR